MELNELKNLSLDSLLLLTIPYYIGIFLSKYIVLIKLKNITWKD